jgi:hypothetical protein
MVNEFDDQTISLYSDDHIGTLLSIFSFGFRVRGFVFLGYIVVMNMIMIWMVDDAYVG